MKFLKRSRRLGQTASEYMVLISVISVMLLTIISVATKPGSPIQEGAKTMADDLEGSMQNTRNMRVQ